MPDLELRMFGVPRLFVDGEETVVSRPRVMECLARIILAGPDGISRSDLCGRIWPGFDPSDARSQLRGTLMKLRGELDKISLAEEFELGGETVRIVGSAACDLLKFKQAPTTDLDGLRLAVQPLAKGWSEENWQSESDEIAHVLANSFERVILGKDCCAAIDLLKRAVHSHPTSASLVTLLVRKLEGSGRIEEANQAIIAFEDAWVDRFGNVDLPRITITPHLLDTTLVGGRPRFGRMSGYAAGLSTVVGVAGLSLGMRSLGHPPMHTSDLKIVSRQEQTLNGHPLEVLGITTDDSRIEGLTHFSDGGICLRISRDRTERQDVIEPDGRIHPGPAFPSTLKDRIEGSSLIGDNSHLAHWNQGHQTVQLEGTDQLPVFDPVEFLADGRVLGVRVSDDPFRSLRQTLIADANGVEFLRPTQSPVPIVVPTFWNRKRVFLSYSAGQNEGWKYHAAEYDLASKAFKPLPYPHIAYESSQGTLVALPQVTSIKDGDYDTHWDGRVLLVHPGTAPVEVSIQGVNQFEYACCFEDCLVVQTSHTSGFRNIQVSPLDSDTAPIQLPEKTSDLFVSGDCRALVYRTYEPNHESHRYTLMIGR